MTHMKTVCIIVQSLYKYDSSLLLIVRRERIGSALTIKESGVHLPSGRKSVIHLSIRTKEAR